MRPLLATAVSFFFCCAVARITPICAQGIPFTLNYKKSSYRGGTQSWDIRQGSDGLIYVANNDGLLEFDGYEWRVAQVANQTILRSIAVAGDGRIFAGAQDEIGWFQPDERGTMHYHSLKNRLPQNNASFEDLWNIEIHGKSTCFQAKDRIYCLRNDSIVVIAAPDQRGFAFMGQAMNRVFVHDAAGTLWEMESDKLRRVADLPFEAGPVSAVLPFRGDTILFTTVKGGIYSLSHGSMHRWNTPLDGFLTENRIYTAVMLPEDKLALGTSRGGIVLLDAERQLTVRLHKGNGLQNNNILSLFCDRQGNLWAGTDNGIDCVMANAPFSFLIPDGELEGTAYTAILSGDNAYFGTANGLYLTNWRHRSALSWPAFQLVTHTQGQVWGLANVQGDLFMGHHEGPFLLKGNQAYGVKGDQGAWTFQALEGHPDYMISGGYGGLYLFQKKNQTWQVVRHLEGLKESCRFMVQEGPGILWVSHPYRGIYRILLSNDLQQADIEYFTKNDGLPSNNFNHVCRVNNEIIFTTESGIYRFNAQTKRFDPHPAYAPYFDEKTRVSRLVEGPDGDVWFAADGQVGILDIADAGIRRDIKKRILPQLAGKLVGGFEFIYPYDGRHVIFGADRGFIFYDRQRKPNHEKVRVLLRKVQPLNPADSSILLALQPIEGTGSNCFRHYQHTFRFTFAAPLFGETDYVKYSYRLEGLEAAWSPWTEKNEKEYTNLRYGNYTFSVKALLPDGKETPAVTFHFEILPPWYASQVARAVYIVLLLSGLGFLIIAPQRRFRKEREQLQTEYRLKEAASRQELEQLKTEKLQAEIGYKNQELASATLHLLQKSEILNKTGEQLQKIAKHSDEAETRQAINGLIRILERDAQFDEEWEQFSRHFDQVHSDFLKRLQGQYPALTPKDQRLCAYLRMNLTSKEVAQLMNISVRGVEISRYRLRKKLQLESEENLTDFLMRV